MGGLRFVGTTVEMQLFEIHERARIKYHVYVKNIYICGIFAILFQAPNTRTSYLCWQIILVEKQNKSKLFIKSFLYGQKTRSLA